MLSAEKSATLFSGAWGRGTPLKLAFQQWHFDLYSSSYQEPNGRAFFFFFFMGEKARWRGGILFLSEVKNIFSTRFISLNSFLSPHSPAVLQVTQPRLSSVKKPPHPLTSCSFLHVLIPPDCLCLSLLVAFLKQSKSPQELRAAATTKTEPKFQSNLQSPQSSTGK